MTERLGEDVRGFSTSFDKLVDDLPTIDTVPEKMELDIDVLAPVVENWILREGDGGLVVHHQCWWVVSIPNQLHPRYICFIIEFMEVLQHKGIILQI